MMVVKWALLVFGLAAVGLLALGKILAFLNPPRPGRPEPPVLPRIRRALRWTLVVPALVGLAVLILSLIGAP